MTQVERDAIVLVEGLGVYCKDCLPKGLYVYNGANWVTSISVEGLFVEKDGLTYGVVLSTSTGETWLDRNLGATQVATSISDADSYGDLYQWGRATDGHEKRGSGAYWNANKLDRVIANIDRFYVLLLDSDAPYNWVEHPIQNTLWKGLDGLNNPCPIGFRIPTQTELLDEVDVLEITNSATAFNSILKLPSAGYRSRVNGQFYDIGTMGRYWTSSTDDVDSTSISLVFSTAATIEKDKVTDRTGGSSVRCIKNDD